MLTEASGDRRFNRLIKNSNVIFPARALSLRRQEKASYAANLFCSSNTLKHRHAVEPLGPRNIIESSVPGERCIGCGLCVAVCREDCIQIAENKDGELKPAAAQRCLSECGVCLQVCPFNEANEQSAVIADKLYGRSGTSDYHPEIGWYHSCWAGFSEDSQERAAGASGGMASWFIRRCLENGLVDRAIVVAPETEATFAYRIIDSPAEVRSAAGSKYYPLTLAHVVRDIVDGPERTYLVTGVPCFLTALRLASRVSPPLQTRVKVLLGFACGQLPNKQLSQALAQAQGGASLQKNGNIRFRCKRADAMDALDYEFRIGEEKKRRGVFGGSMYGLYGFFWVNRYFVHRACYFCQDVFAEAADIVFMDAWLPELIDDPRGTNLIAVRSAELTKIIQEGVDKGGCAAAQIGADKIAQSQLDSIAMRRHRLRDRSSIVETAGKPNRNEAKTRLLRRDLFQMHLSEWSKEFYPRYQCLGRPGIVFFVVHSIVAHLHRLPQFIWLLNIVPLLRAVQRAAVVRCGMRIFKPSKRWMKR